MKKAVEVKALNDHRIWLRFADGVEGEVDLSHLAGRGVFRAWADRKVFENVHVDGSGAIVWNEELDLCPDALYLRLTGKTPEDLFPALKTSVDA
jgi:broad-specificity NMP kinase